MSKKLRVLLSSMEVFRRYSVEHFERALSQSIDSNHENLSDTKLPRDSKISVLLTHRSPRLAWSEIAM